LGLRRMDPDCQSAEELDEVAAPMMRCRRNPSAPHRLPKAAPTPRAVPSTAITPDAAEVRVWTWQDDRDKKRFQRRLLVEGLNRFRGPRKPRLVTDGSESLGLAA